MKIAVAGAGIAGLSAAWLLARQHEGRLAFRISRVTFLNGGLFPEATRPLPIQRLLAGPLGHDADGRGIPSFERIFRIAQQIVNDLAQLCRIAQHLGQVAGESRRDARPECAPRRSPLCRIR